MKIENNLYSYLKGEKFSNSLIAEISDEKYIPVSRESAITRMIMNSDVIHLGCSDHINIIREKISNNKWLHKLITDNSKNCLGIDIDGESINFLKNELGYKNVIQANILEGTINEITSKKWDIVVFGELIEHLDNPVDFLNSFSKKYSDYVDRFIITVPSIYCKIQLKNMLEYREVINSDHRFWFTPYTISKILVAAGYLPEKISYANLQSLNTKELIVRKIKRFFGSNVTYPFYYFNTIIITGRLKNISTL